jgi:hypothetical protein
MPVLAKNLLTQENTTSVVRPNWSAAGSGLVADALRRNQPLPTHVRLRVHGESMLPALWPGDEVEIANYSLADLRPGEIVLALREGRLFLHRFVARYGLDRFVLRGDSMPGPDPVFPAEALLGRLVNRVGVSHRPRLATVSRAIGVLLCHCAPARRVALKVHSMRKVSARKSQQDEADRPTAPAEFVFTELQRR